MAKPSNATITMNGEPAIGKFVSFTVETDEQFPWIEVQCFDPDTGNLVYSQLEAAFDHGQTPFPFKFQLGPTSLWPSGPAHGHASAFLSTRGTRRKYLADIMFEVSG